MKKIIHRDIKLENIFITNDNNFKLGKILIIIFLSVFFFFFFGVTEGDYGISRKEGVSMTAGAGTQFVKGNEWNNRICIFFFFFLIRHYQALEILNEEKYGNL
jgi:serine/threonine protein kinase